jgi:hypothetical protein
VPELDGSRLQRAQDKQYPPYVRTDEQRRRWELAAGIARLLFDVEADVWVATRTIYRSPLPTGEWSLEIDETRADEAR